MKRKSGRGRGLYASICVDDHAPYCSHGPKLRLEKKYGGTPSYTCSAFRNQPACQNDYIFTVKLHQMQLFVSDISKNGLKSTGFCHTCGVLFTDPSDVHAHHNVVRGLSSSQLKTPTYFLKTLEKSSEHAQYFFSDGWLEFMVSTLGALQIDNILCVGAPRLFDFLEIQNFSINKFLLDLDTRLESFYPSTQFARFNALNGYFFSPTGKSAAENFMLSRKGRTVIFCDPPFGALMEPLIVCLNKLKEGLADSEVFMMITIPYFLGKRLLQAAAQLKMLDYKVTYEKHGRFTSTGHDGNDSKRRVSVVRLFTDAPTSEIKPPKGLESHYWFCEICERYSDLNNKHCRKCNSCTTLHGDTYKHCKVCNVCRPPSYKHCNQCDRCFRWRDNECHLCAKEQSDDHHRFKRGKFAEK